MSDLSRQLEADQPRYYVIYRTIAQEIANGSLQPGDRLPVERALCERFGVSRATVRRALGALVAEGLVESHVRRGSFVAASALVEPPNVLIGFAALAEARGFAVSARVLSKTVRPATLDESDVLEIPPGADVFELERLRFLEQRPVLLEIDRLPLSRTPGADQADYSSESLYETLETKSGVSPARAEYTIEAVAADERSAELLDVEVGSPLLRVADITFDAAGAPICVANQLYRGDRYRFQTTLHRSPLAGGVRPDAAVTAPAASVASLPA